jgi:hypothetical protein
MGTAGQNEVKPMFRWLTIALFCVLAIALPVSTLQYADNRIDTYPHGAQHRDINGDPVIGFGTTIIDYVCQTRTCPFHDTRIVHGIYSRHDGPGGPAFIFGIVAPAVLLILAAFLAGRASKTHR